MPIFSNEKRRIKKYEKKRQECDVIILGAGASGLSAAIYASRAKLRTIVIDESVPGGQAASTYHVENYPETPGVIRGKELIKNMREQALSFGAEIDDLKEISEVSLKGDIKYVKTKDEELFKNNKIDVIWESEVRKVNGQGHSLTSVVIENLKTKELKEIPTDGAFVYIGTQPKSDMFKGQVEIDKWGYIVAAEDTKTNIEGVFAAGDIRTKPIRQVVTAAADGAVAGIMDERYIASKK